MLKSKNMKSLLQLMAAAENGRDVLYFTFGDEKLRDEIFDVFTMLKSRKVSVGSLYNVSYRCKHFIMTIGFGKIVFKKWH